MITKTNILICLAIIVIASCCRHKTDDTLCNAASIPVEPFIERYGVFFCGGNDYEYTYTARKKVQIDSLSSCTFSPPVAFPVDETNMVYLMVGRMSYHHRDTFQTSLFKDTCLKKLIYEVNMIQTDTAFECCPYGIGAVRSMFCSVQNIPADYDVEVKYKYIPIQ